MKWDASMTYSVHCGLPCTTFSQTFIEKPQKSLNALKAKRKTRCWITKASVNTFPFQRLPEGILIASVSINCAFKSGHKSGEQGASWLPPVYFTIPVLQSFCSLPIPLHSWSRFLRYYSQRLFRCDIAASFNKLIDNGAIRELMTCGV